MSQSLFCDIFSCVPVDFWTVLVLFSLLLICMLLLSVSNAGRQLNCCMAVCLCIADFGAGPAAWWRSVSVPTTVHVVWPSAEPVEARRPEEGTCVYNFILTRLARCSSGYAGSRSEVTTAHSDQSVRIFDVWSDVEMLLKKPTFIFSFIYIFAQIGLGLDLMIHSSIFHDLPPNFRFDPMNGCFGQLSLSTHLCNVWL